MRYNEVLKRLQNLINVAPTQAELCGITGLKSNTMSNRAVRNSEFSKDEISLINNFYKINLFTNTLTDNTQSEDNVQIDYYPDIYGSCRAGVFILSENKEKITVSRSVLTSYSKSRKYSVINARGDSMMPTIQNDDRLIVEHWEGEQITDNSIYVFRYGDEVFVKRLVKNIDQIIIISDNHIYPIRIIEGEKLNDLQIIGKIVGLMRKMI